MLRKRPSRHDVSGEGGNFEKYPYKIPEIIPFGGHSHLPLRPLRGANLSKRNEVMKIQ